MVTTKTDNGNAKLARTFAAVLTATTPALGNEAPQAAPAGSIAKAPVDIRQLVVTAPSRAEHLILPLVSAITPADGLSTDQIRRLNIINSNLAAIAGAEKMAALDRVNPLILARAAAALASARANLTSPKTFDAGMERTLGALESINGLSASTQNPVNQTQISQNLTPSIPNPITTPLAWLALPALRREVVEAHQDLMSVPDSAPYPVFEQKGTRLDVARDRATTSGLGTVLAGGLAVAAYILLQRKQLIPFAATASGAVGGAMSLLSGEPSSGLIGAAAVAAVIAATHYLEKRHQATAASEIGSSHTQHA